MVQDLGCVGLVGGVIGVVDGTFHGSPLPGHPALFGEGIESVASGAFPLVVTVTIAEGAVVHEHRGCNFSEAASLSLGFIGFEEGRVREVGMVSRHVVGDCGDAILEVGLVCDRVGAEVAHLVLVERKATGYVEWLDHRGW